MCAKRSTSSASGGSSGSSGSADHAVTNAVLLIAALGWGVSMLVAKGRLTWPPIALLSSLSTIAGCLAIVGPLILARSGAAKGGSLGELAWLAGGLIIWLFDLAAIAQGQARSVNWAMPLGDRTMGLVILAILLAGWRCGLASRNWSWTNVTGWALSLFWVGMAAGTWFLSSSSGLSSLVSR